MLSHIIIVAPADNQRVGIDKEDSIVVLQDGAARAASNTIDPPGEAGRLVGSSLKTGLPPDNILSFHFYMDSIKLRTQSFKKRGKRGEIFNKSQ